MTDTRWVPLASPFDRYEVSSAGGVRNRITGHSFSKSSRVGAYQRVTLSPSDGSGPRGFLVHRLVAMAFVPRNEEGNEVDHINHDPSDNRAANLRWVSLQTNRRHQRRRGRKKGRAILQLDLEGRVLARYERICDAPFGNSSITSACAGRLKQAYGYRWAYDEQELLGPETWKAIQFGPSSVRVSDQGRVELASGKITRGWPSGSGYLQVSFGRRTTLVHRLVAAAFCRRPDDADEKWVVHHHNEDKTDNRASNLKWVTPSTNVKASWNRGRRRLLYVRQVSAVPVTGGKPRTYSSIHEAARQTGATPGNIVMAAQGRRPSAGGFKWIYV